MEKLEFCRFLGISENQFNGIDNTYKIINIIYMLRELPEGFSPKINYSLDLRCLEFIPNGFNPIILNGDLYLDRIEYWPSWFKPQVSGKIFLKKLKSQILMDLILHPGTSRQLAFNLLK